MSPLEKCLGVLVFSLGSSFSSPQYTCLSTRTHSGLSRTRRVMGHDGSWGGSQLAGQQRSNTEQRDEVLCCCCSASGSAQKRVSCSAVFRVARTRTLQSHSRVAESGERRGTAAAAGECV